MRDGNKAETAPLDEAGNPRVRSNDDAAIPLYCQDHTIIADKFDAPLSAG